MEDETHGGQEEALGQEGGAAAGQQQQEQGAQAEEVGAPDYEKAIAERDEKIAELKAQGESDRIDFRHQRASVSRVLDCELGVLSVEHIDSNLATKDRRERGRALLGVDVGQMSPTNDRTCILTC